jgi:hypothetical protein
MSGKNRAFAFALAIATAALVGFCAPMANAATFGGPNTGFNGDSILNLSGNQLPINACNNQIPIQGIGAQVPLQSITGLLGIGNTGDSMTRRREHVDTFSARATDAQITDLSELRAAGTAR